MLLALARYDMEQPFAVLLFIALGSDVVDGWLARTLRVIAAVASTALACGLWLYVIHLAVAGGQTPFFQARTFVPSGPAALIPKTS